MSHFFLNCTRLHQFSDSLQWILPKYFLSRFLDAAWNDCFILLKSKAKQKRGNIPHYYKFNFLSFKWSLCLLWLGNTIFIQTSHSSSLQGSAPWPLKFMADINYCWKEKHLWLLLFSSGSSEWVKKTGTSFNTTPYSQILFAIRTAWNERFLPKTKK